MSGRQRVALSAVVSRVPICQSGTALKVAYQSDTAQGLQIVDLRQLSALDLDPLLLDETAEWARELDWNFSKSADLVRKLSGERRLGGLVLLDRGEVAGYGYIGLEDHIGAIGDVYVRPAWRRGNAEAALLRALFDALIGISAVRRIESQLMLVEAASAKALQRERPVQLYERLLMTREANAPLSPGRASTAARFRMEPWSDRDYDAVATVVSLAYSGHIDAQINDRYRTLAGASRFLRDLVQFPGCAAFCSPASYVAFDMTTGLPAGVSLSNFVAGDVAHIAEICVTPQARGAGLGYELLRKTAEALRGAGAKRISLTVTAANEEAVRLYTRCGFRELRRFCAFVWERPTSPAATR